MLSGFIFINSFLKTHAFQKKMQSRNIYQFQNWRSTQNLKLILIFKKKTISVFGNDHKLFARTFDTYLKFYIKTVFVQQLAHSIQNLLKLNKMILCFWLFCILVKRCFQISIKKTLMLFWITKTMIYTVHVVFSMKKYE